MIAGVSVLIPAGHITVGRSPVQFTKEEEEEEEEEDQEEEEEVEVEEENREDYQRSAKVNQNTQEV